MQEIEAAFTAADAVLFDWDGTLADSHAAHYQALCTTMAPLGITVALDWYLTATGMSTSDSIAWLAAEASISLTEPDLAGLATHCETAYLTHLDLVQEITWVADLARAWRGRRPLAVASGSSARTIEQTMRRLGLGDNFDTVVSRDDVAAGKPAPDIFLLAATRLGVPAQRCLVLEDSDAGIEAARRAGASVVDVREHTTHH